MDELKSKLGKINWKFWRTAGYWLIIGILAVIAVITALSAINIPNGIKLYTVQTGSMAPAIPTGSIALLKSSENYQKGDVITFKSEKNRFNNNPERTTTHRIHAIEERDGAPWYVTKGDANPSPDSNLVRKGLVLGGVIFSVPFLGYTVSFTKTIPGFILLIVVPGTLFIFSEILNIKKELGLMFEGRRKNENKAY